MAANRSFELPGVSSRKTPAGRAGCARRRRRCRLAVCVRHTQEEEATIMQRRSNARGTLRTFQEGWMGLVPQGGQGGGGDCIPPGAGRD